MSVPGQKAKYSLRADVFRFTPGSGHPACGLECPSCANSRRKKPAARHVQTVAAWSFSIGARKRLIGRRASMAGILSQAWMFEHQG
jgi:hypothetical protein